MTAVERAQVVVLSRNRSLEQQKERLTELTMWRRSSLWSLLYGRFIALALGYTAVMTGLFTPSEDLVPLVLLTVTGLLLVGFTLRGIAATLAERKRGRGPAYRWCRHAVAAAADLLARAEEELARANAAETGILILPSATAAVEAILRRPDRDWTANTDDAELWAMVVGGREADELALTLGWDADTIARLRALHEAWTWLALDESERPHG